MTEAVEKSMISLVNQYSTIGEAAEEGLIKHGSYYVRGGAGPDDYMIWGDYYYLEALLRLTKGYPAIGMREVSIIESVKRTGDVA